MSTVGDTSSASRLPVLSYDKPVVVRVKRKESHSRLDAFWLEINERPLKRPLLDFEKLSLSGSSEKEGLTTKKVFVQHVETLRTSEATVDIVLPFVDHNYTNTVQNKTKSDERQKTFKDIGKQDQILVKARHEQEILAKHARFEQIWRSRKGNDKANQSTLSEMCRFYDVVRVDGDERSNEVPQVENLSQEDQKILSSYLPLLRELIPTAATEIESDIQQQSCSSKEASTDDYLYDYYTVTLDEEMLDGNGLCPYPLVKVDEEEFYDGPDDSEYSSDDSNAEYNPHNDYPDEISEEEESESEPSDGESEISNKTDSNSDVEESVDIEISDEDEDQRYYDEIFYDDDVDSGGYCGNFDSDDCGDEAPRCSSE